jgi:23S rRNA (guanosine2251-2'-O)-methyltransferase
MGPIRPPRRDRSNTFRRGALLAVPAAADKASRAVDRARRDAPRVKDGRRSILGERLIYGRHAVTAALANPERRWHRLAALAGHEAEAHALVAGALATWRGEGEAVRVLGRDTFAAILPEGAVHQGLALEVDPLAERSLEDVMRHAATASGRCIIVVLDQVSDPHNVGAVLRSAAAFGALAVMLAEHGGPPVSGTLAKSASGALETVPLVRVVNLARALDRLKESGFWICGLDETAPHTLPALDLADRIGLVLGSEGDGMRRLVRARCDHLARLPTLAAQPTLNVSNAAAVALYELRRAGGAGCARPAEPDPRQLDHPRDHRPISRKRAE